MKSNSRVWFAVLTTMLLLSCNSDSMAALIAKSSSTFSHKYEGQYPVPDYTQSGAFTSGPSSDGDILTVATPNVGGGYFSSSLWAGAVDNATGWTLEWRALLLDDAAEPAGGAFQFAIGDGLGYRAFRLHKNFTDTRFPTDQILDSNSNTDAYHTMRVAREPGSADWLVWRDGVSLGTVAQSVINGTKFLDIGDGSSGVGGPTVKVDFVRFDNTGAYAPVPEPATWMVLGVGTVILLSTRKGGRLRAPFFLAAAAGIVLSNCGNVALAVTTKDSAEFSHLYEGEYPTTNYTQFGVFSVGPSSDGDILSFATPNPNGGYFQSDQWVDAINNATGWTVEWRMKIVGDATEFPSGTMQVGIGDSAGYRVFRVFRNFFTTRFPTDHTMDSNVNTDDFHTFRVAREPNSVDWLVWRDGIPVGHIIDSDQGAGGEEFLQVGDGSSINIGGPTVELDYVRFDNTGAFSPISPLLLGDYNDDGVVDAADYTVWRDGAELFNDETPGNQPGDYDVWKAHFGESRDVGVGSVAGVVPEPSSLCLVAALVVVTSMVAGRSKIGAQNRQSVN
jgi:hypothetical protein